MSLFNLLTELVGPLDSETVTMGLLKGPVIFELKAGFVLDKEDRSITRSDLYFKELFGQCGLHLYKSKVCPTVTLANPK
ncbi:Alpha N-terminal protein methyltransferase 1 [Vitis vinifera]|uniref:Alpha N-terminal protein methyltransferase 1 n=1 Tax=Vitis vinifera TaxID=29760 RepID=A0A438IV11_VITVI|nr:Alpha N-terminal protein methyltransferase 1 [Vitis vinifera]